MACTDKQQINNNKNHVLVSFVSASGMQSTNIQKRERERRKPYRQQTSQKYQKSFASR